MNDFKTMSDYFRAAMIICIKTKQCGSQISIAEGTGINRSYLNQFLNGKKESSEKMRIKLSEYIGFRYEELLILGRMLSELCQAEQEQINLFAENINYELYRKIRIQNEYSVEQFASIIGISPLKYRFKEKGFLPFMISEIHAIMKFMDNKEEISKKFDKVSKIVTEVKETIDKKIKDLQEDEKKILKIRLREEFTNHLKKIDSTYEILLMLWEKMDNQDNMPDKKPDKILL
ncbi:MAG: helix-turn-helix transcriptional regulator [Deltaproteobacteria bacterium]|nr:helix-turn-helix transcriptional regulator [Deltaproteobacteria bacterium]